MSQVNINNAIVSQRHNIESYWKANPNFVPNSGEIIVYDADETYKFPRIKIGDGSTTIEALPFSQIQPDFNQTDSTSPDYIKNKPAEATQQASGLLSSDDKVKLDGIEAEANKTIVDTELDASSNNPVTNQAITAKLDELTQAVNAKAAVRIVTWEADD